MHVLRTRLIQRLRDGRPPRPLPRVLPARSGPAGGLLPRRALQADDRRRRDAARRLGQPLQPLDGRRHRVRRRDRGARRRRASPRRSATSATACSPSTWARSRHACARRSSAPARCTARSPRSRDEDRTLRSSTTAGMVRGRARTSPRSPIPRSRSRSTSCRPTASRVRDAGRTAGPAWGKLALLRRGDRRRCGALALHAARESPAPSA